VRRTDLGAAGRVSYAPPESLSFLMAGKSTISRRKVRESGREFQKERMNRGVGNKAAQLEEEREQEDRRSKSLGAALTL